VSLKTPVARWHCGECESLLVPCSPYGAVPARRAAHVAGTMRCDNRHCPQNGPVLGPLAANATPKGAA
jgi:ribosomal protein S27AE